MYEVFYNYCVDNNIEFSPEYDFREQYWFYQGCGFDNERTVEAIKQHKEFMDKNIPVALETVEPMIKSGIMYAYKRDIAYWPILIINVKKLVQS